MKNINTLIKGANVFFSGFNKESSGHRLFVGAADDSTYTLEVAELENKLKATREACLLAKQINDKVRADTKLEVVKKLEDGIKKSCDDED